MAAAQTAGPSRPQITMAVDEFNRVPLAGSRRPEANRHNDRGLVSDSLPLEHIQMLLHRPAAQEKAFEKLIDDLHNPSSPSFHKWLTANEVGRRFGVSMQDIDAIAARLTRHGFKVNTLMPSRVILDFSGTAGKIREAFHTEIHDLDVNGEHHIANMSDSQVPAALAPAIAGIVSLNDFRPKPEYTYNNTCQPLVNGQPTSTCYVVVPDDLHTIYNFTPLLTQQNPITGKNQKIVVIEPTDLYNFPDDWNAFRSKFGLDTYAGTLAQDHPNILHNCSDPGVVLINEAEAIVDAEWSSAAAPDSAIEVAACKDTSTTSGILIALENRTSQSGPPQPLATISISYGRCEVYLGTANSTYNSVYQAAVAQGYSIYVAAGDSGSSPCAFSNEKYALYGVGVSGLASSPYVVAVGGTDFGDTYAGKNGTYWNDVNHNGPYYGSALSYIPEVPWNASCASELLAFFYTGSRGGWVRLDRISPRISGSSAGCDMPIWTRSAGRA